MVPGWPDAPPTCSRCPPPASLTPADVHRQRRRHQHYCRLHDRGVLQEARVRRLPLHLLLPHRLHWARHSLRPRLPQVRVWVGWWACGRGGGGRRQPCVHCCGGAGQAQGWGACLPSSLAPPTCADLRRHPSPARAAGTSTPKASTAPSLTASLSAVHEHYCRWKPLLLHAPAAPPAGPPMPAVLACCGDIPWAGLCCSRLCATHPCAYSTCQLHQRSLAGFCAACCSRECGGPGTALSPLFISGLSPPSPPPSSRSQPRRDLCNFLRMQTGVTQCSAAAQGSGEARSGKKGKAGYLTLCSLCATLAESLQTLPDGSCTDLLVGTPAPLLCVNMYAMPTELHTQSQLSGVATARLRWQKVQLWSLSCRQAGAVIQHSECHTAASVKPRCACLPPAAAAWAGHHVGSVAKNVGSLTCCSVRQAACRTSHATCRAPRLLPLRAAPTAALSRAQTELWDTAPAAAAGRVLEATVDGEEGAGPGCYDGAAGRDAREELQQPAVEHPDVFCASSLLVCKQPFFPAW